MSELRKPEEVIPHRDPLLFLTEVTELHRDADGEVVGADGYWDLSGEEWFFPGHFPGNPILPGYFGAESLAQLGCYAALHIPRFKDELLVLASWGPGKPKFKIKPPVRVDLHVELEQVRRISGTGIGTAYVYGRLALESSMQFAVDLEERKKRLNKDPGTGRN